jgi:heme a synthase
MNQYFEVAEAKRRWLRAGLIAACFVCVALIAFGGFVRLQHAGLGCPDWPTCYGKLTWPTHAGDVAIANALHPDRPVEHSKTWPEQVHRIIAGGLGLLVLGLALAANRAAKASLAPILAAVALIGISIPLYIKTHYYAASFFAIAGECLLIAAALRTRLQSRWLLVALGWICVQALFGMWTVTWKLKPFIVTAHLLGGMALIALLFWSTIRADFPPATPRAQRPLPNAILLIAFAALVLQIALGGWVSTNYASWACPDFPRCQGVWLPPTDFKEAFVLWRGIGVDYEGGILDGSARTAIHLTHRIGGVVAGTILLLLGLWAYLRGLKIQGTALIAVLTLQIALGIANIKYALPLPVAVAHNGVAAILLVTLLWLIHQVRYAPAYSTPSEKRKIA